MTENLLKYYKKITDLSLIHILITAPRGSALPMAPNKKNILLVAFALGLLVPAVIIFMQENMNTKAVSYTHLGKRSRNARDNTVLIYL